MEDLHQSKSSNEEEKPQAEQVVELKDYDDETEEDDMSGQMTENAFSLIFITDSNHITFWISMFFVVFQISMLCLVLVDMIEPDNIENPLGVPKHVSSVVRIAGFLSLFLSVAIYDDFTDAIDKLVRDPVAVGNESRHKTHFKYYLAFTLQLAVGLLFLIAIFILIVRSTDVLTMFLNYAALQFISNVDDIMFAISAKGYVGRVMKKECKKVADFQLPPPKQRFIRRIVYYSVIIVLFIMYGIVFGQQINGRFDCRLVEVQFGDGFIPYLPVFSGHYTYHAEFHDGRPIYKDETGKAIFRYCHKGGSGYWVFGWFSPVTGISNMDELCTNFVLRTPNTHGFEMLDLPASNWLVKKEAGAKLEYSVDYLVIKCVECDESNCNGSCQDKTCVCGESQYGNKCEFIGKPCGMVDYDRNTNQFNGAGKIFSSQYTLLEKSDGEPAFAYGRPLYAYFFNSTQGMNFGLADVLMNMGRRYVMIGVNVNNTNLFPNVTDIHSELANYLEGVHPWYDWWEEKLLPTGGMNNSVEDVTPVAFVSNPVDDSDSLAPVGVTWSRATQYGLPLSLSTSVSTVLMCAECSDSYPCMNSGICINETSKCNCFYGFEGPMCEKEPACLLAGECSWQV